MNPATVRRIISHEARTLRLPIGAACACGESDPVVLLASDPPLCFDCNARASGRSVIEHHHVGGKPCPIVAPVTRNVHARLTLVQQLTWRALGAAPASPEAIVIDLLALSVFGDEA